MQKQCLIATPLVVLICLGGAVSAQIHAPPNALSLSAASSQVTPPVATPVATVAEATRGRAIRITGEVIRVIDQSQFRITDQTGSISVHLPWAGSSLVTPGDRVVVEGVVDDEMTFGLSRPEIHAASIRLPSGAVISFTQPGSSQPGSSRPDSSRPDSSRPDSSRPEALGPGAGSPNAGESGERHGAQESEQSPRVSLIASVLPGQSAKISGRVVRILDTDEFRLEDESGSVRVYIGWRHRLPASVGERVTVVGTLDDDPWPVRPEFYAESVTLEDGRVIRLGNTPDAASPAESIVAETAPLAAPRPEIRTPIGDLRAYNKVLIEGVVERITDEDEFRIRDDSGSVRVYIGWLNPMPVRTGQRVGVYGIVDASGPLGMLKEVYAYEITSPDGRVIDLQPDRGVMRSEPASVVHAAPVHDPSDADIAADITTDIMTVQSVRRGQSVTLRGEVARIGDTDEFVLRDDTGSIRIYIGWRNRMPVSAGESVTVSGFADDGIFFGFRPEIYADRIVLADGRIITLERGGYGD